MKPALTKKKENQLDNLTANIFLQVPMQKLANISIIAKNAYLKGEDMKTAILDYVNSIRMN